MQERAPTMSANGKQARLLLTATLFLLGAAGCAKPCEQLVEKLSAEWNSPEKCEEWRHVDNEAGGESCEASLKRLQNRAQ